MNALNLYEIFLHIFNSNVDFDVIFYEVESPYKEEIQSFINFMKKKPSFEEFKKYNVTDFSKKVLLNFVEETLKKLKI